MRKRIQQLANGKFDNNGPKLSLSTEKIELEALEGKDETGSFEKGRKADFIVLDYAATPSQQIRREYLERNGKWELENKLFGLQTLGDDRNIVATYIMGKRM